MELLHSVCKQTFRVTVIALALLFCHSEARAAQLQLSWTDNSTNEDGFKIERGPSTSGPFTQITTVLSNITSYTDSGLADATQFCYRVRAYNTGGDSTYTNTACSTTKATLTLAKAGNGSGSVSSTPAGITCGSTCSASYTAGTSVTLTATPAAGSLFTGWSGACTGTGSCVVTMSAAQSVTATFTLQTFNLTLTKAGAGSGTVTSSPSGINCGTTCSASFNNGTSVTLTASASAGSTFAGWSGACTGTGSCVVSMTSAQSVTATFNLQNFTLTLAKAGAGSGNVTSSPAGIDCGTTCSGSYTNGTSVTLTPTAAAGSTFGGWSGACTGTGSCVVSMTSAKSVTATFNLQTFALTATKSGTGSGTITSSPAGINCGSTCSANYTIGTSVTLTATAAAGSTFTGWTGVCTGTGPCVVTVDAAKSAGAGFNTTPPSAPGGLSIN
jgi:hypothetical protein